MNWSLQDTVMKSAYLATQKLLELQKAQVCGITNQTENPPEAEGAMILKILNICTVNSQDANSSK